MPPPRIRVTVLSPAGCESDQLFEAPFRLGRADECDVCIRNEFVSRVHAEVVFLEDQWRLRDLNSSNGIFVACERVESLALAGKVAFRLGVKGPEISLEIEEPELPQPAIGEKEQLAKYISHYFDASGEDIPAGEHTVFVRKAFAEVQSKERKRYRWISAFLGLLILAASLFAFYEHYVITQQKATAEILFYSMKALDVDIANLERVAFRSSDEVAKQEVEKFQSRRVETQKSYDTYLETLGVYDRKMTPRHRLILRVARIFGECELTMPPEFESEIDRYIKGWQSTQRLKNALAKAKQNNYTGFISRELLEKHLPPQFFYLALQESDFDPYISGPSTSKGIAKGMWQFIPETAIKYGLHLGPLTDMRRPDPGDDRHYFDRETKAAVTYLKDLYSTDAQASGLLVIASYNWGEGRVLPLIRSMPDNPRERNFWQLLLHYRDKVPQETYDYVFNIAAAAVIGEDPRMFGFDFDNPLAGLEAR